MSIVEIEKYLCNQYSVGLCCMPKMSRQLAIFMNVISFKRRRDDGDRVVELMPANGGAVIMVHAAAKSVKSGQVTAKLVFDIEDIEGFRGICMAKGLAFGTIHKANGYTFSNAKDPDGNSISISSRAFALLDS